MRWLGKVRRWCKVVGFFEKGRLLGGFAFSKNGALSSVILFYSSLYWISATIFLTSSTIAGSSRLVCSSFDPEKIWRYIDSYKVVVLACVAALKLMSRPFRYP